MNSRLLAIGLYIPRLVAVGLSCWALISLPPHHKPLGTLIFSLAFLIYYQIQALIDKTEK